MLRTAVCGVVLRKGQILLVRKDEAYILPGGKPEPNENDIQCLVREFSEELPNLIIKRITKYYGSFTGQIPHTGDCLEAKVYRVEVEGKIEPSSEISESKWVPISTAQTYPLSDITSQVIAAMYQVGASSR